MSASQERFDFWGVWVCWLRIARAKQHTCAVGHAVQDAAGNVVGVIALENVLVHDAVVRAVGCARGQREVRTHIARRHQENVDVAMADFPTQRIEVAVQRVL